MAIRVLMALQSHCQHSRQYRRSVHETHDTGFERVALGDACFRAGQESYPTSPIEFMANSLILRVYDVLMNDRYFLG